MTPEQLAIKQQAERIAALEKRLDALADLYSRYVERLRRFFPFVEWPESL